jgi:parvulin-like peptidyl-prolyl isomerase
MRMRVGAWVRAGSSVLRKSALVGFAGAAALSWGGCGGGNNDRDAKVRATADAMAHAEIVALYNQNIDKFITPQSRDVEVIRTRTLQAGEKARAQIDAGVPFAKVAARFSVDGLGKTNGGLVLGVLRSQEDRVIAKALFSAKLHVLTGPVRLEPGRYYLFRIRRIRPPKHITLASYEASQLAHFRQQYYAQLKSLGQAAER